MGRCLLDPRCSGFRGLLRGGPRGYSRTLYSRTLSWRGSLCSSFTGTSPAHSHLLGQGQPEPGHLHPCHGLPGSWLMGWGEGQVVWGGGCCPSLNFHSSFSLPPARQELCFLPGPAPAPHSCLERLARQGFTWPQGCRVSDRARGKSEETPGQEEETRAKTLLAAKPPRVYP